MNDYNADMLYRFSVSYNIACIVEILYHLRDFNIALVNLTQYTQHSTYGDQERYLMEFIPSTGDQQSILDQLRNVGELPQMEGCAYINDPDEMVRSRGPFASVGLWGQYLVSTDYSNIRFTSMMVRAPNLKDTRLCVVIPNIDEQINNLFSALSIWYGKPANALGPLVVQVDSHLVELSRQAGGLSALFEAISQELMLPISSAGFVVSYADMHSNNGGDRRFVEIVTDPAYSANVWNAIYAAITSGKIPNAQYTPPNEVFALLLDLNPSGNQEGVLRSLLDHFYQHNVWFTSLYTTVEASAPLSVYAAGENIETWS